jgi:hypothetical protein
MAKDVSSKKVIMVSCAPPIRYPNGYGIDMASRSSSRTGGLRGKSRMLSTQTWSSSRHCWSLDLVTSVRQLN